MGSFRKAPKGAFLLNLFFNNAADYINKHMKHFIYKTIHKNGKYYIGRHSTDNIDDGYIGSGKWPLSIKDKTSLKREILEYAESFAEIKELERKYLAENFGKPNCMNRTPDPIGFDTDNNPMKNPNVADKIKGDNHWTKQDGSDISIEILRKKQNKLVAEGKHFFQQDNHPNKDGSCVKKALERKTHINYTNNPSIWRSEQGIHHWQNGNAPNAGGKLNKKLIEEGRHNFLGPDLNNKRIAEGTHNFLGGDSNQRRLAAGTHPSQMKKTCEHCGKTSSVSMYARWHGENCKFKLNNYRQT